MFIGRRPDGTIYGSWTSRQPDDADHLGMEEVSDDHPDLVAFLKPPTVIVKTPTLADIISVLTDEQKAKLGVHG